MEKLPAIGDHIIERPGATPTGAPHVHHVPEGESFWMSLYKHMREEYTFSLPVRKANVDPFFGRFGYRFHPTRYRERYFHLGIDIHGTRRKGVYPTCDGVLEYAGYGAINGKYVFLSHPQIQTEDGFVLHSLYMHLSRITVGFNSYQKMLREISFHTYPVIPVAADMSLGRIGTSGLPEQTPPHLHFQVEFRKKDTIVAIDPVQLIGKRPRVQENRSTDITYDTFSTFYHAHAKELAAWKPLWKKHLPGPRTDPLIQ